MAASPFVCDAFGGATNCSSALPAAHVSFDNPCSMSSFDVIYVAACSSFLTIVCAALFNFLKIHVNPHRARWRPPPTPDFATFIRSTKQSYIAQAQRQAQSKRIRQSAPSLGAFPPKNNYFNVVDRAYKTFLESIHGTERDGWLYQGEKKGIKKYKKDVHGSPFSIFRGEKIVCFPQHILFHAIRHKPMRLAISDGQMKDCGALEVVDANCKIEFEGTFSFHIHS